MLKTLHPLSWSRNEKCHVQDCAYDHGLFVSFLFSISLIGLILLTAAQHQCSQVASPAWDFVGAGF